MGSSSQWYLPQRIHPGKRCTSSSQGLPVPALPFYLSANLQCLAVVVVMVVAVVSDVGVHIFDIEGRDYCFHMNLN
jgi:hypothetical protein